MDPALTQMLAQQFGLTPEQQAALQAGDVESVIAAKTQDPRLAAIWNWMKQHKTSDNQNEEKDREKIKQLQHAVQQLRAALDAADVMLKHLASVFGSCPYCWGRNTTCRRCHGHGVPGSSEPDREQLLAWAGPAFRRIGMQIVAAEASTAKAS